MSMAMVISGFALGAAGSLHCAGMCGPLCIMLPQPDDSRAKKMTRIGLYQMGRVITYSLIGLLLGLAGRRFYIAGYQQWFSIITGALALLLAMLYFFQKNFNHTGILRSYFSAVQSLLARSLQRANSYQGSLIMGMANGLLPCGMVYMATLAAISFTHIGDSVVFMSLFGLGTVPMLFVTAYAGQSMKWKTKLALQKMIPAFIIITGCILILRGLNLGIPFLSPHFTSFNATAIDCHP